MAGRSALSASQPVPNRAGLSASQPVPNLAPLSASQPVPHPTLVELDSVTVPAVCAVPDCDRPRAANGLCNAHEHRRRRGKPLDTPLRQYKVKGCSVEGCPRPHTARGYCHLHWKQNRYGPPTRRVRTPDEVAAIRKLHAAGLNMTEIARRFDCSRSTVMRVVRGMTFKANSD